MVLGFHDCYRAQEKAQIFSTAESKKIMTNVGYSLPKSLFFSPEICQNPHPASYSCAGERWQAVVISAMP